PVVQTASPAPTTQPAPTPTPSTSSQVVEAPTPGNILRLEVKVGDQVSENQTLLIMEAMKMESEVKSPTAGKISELHVSTGDTVQAGEPLLTISN
ncbi:MAG: acetyl-CoA carboxylase biotin carboxyl carrier protein subunit, partial [Deltaproteobacteria bacterium]